VTILVVGYGVLYSLFVKAMMHYNPPLKAYQIVFLHWPQSSKLTVTSVLIESLGYIFTWTLWTIIFTMAWFATDYSRQQKAMILAQQKQVETELNFLKSQINPHFLFNTLNNLYALALKKSDLTPDAILKLSAILRYLLYESNTPTVSFDKEKEIMEAYIDLELLRLTDKDNLHFTISADKPYHLPPLLWLPVLENVFKHGTRTMSGNNVVEYYFEIKNDQLFIFSKNNEKMLAKSTSENGGIGLTNLEKRLEILYPHKHSISARHENNYYISEVKIDLA
jgi:LytS/YehU family sensor histidine kinase